MKSTLVLCALLLLLFTAFSSFNYATAKKRKQPNIVLIMADDVSPMHFSCYGGVVNTPHIDKLAADGMLFNRAYCTSPACTPSRYSIHTGQYAGRSKNDELHTTDKKNEMYNLEWNSYITKENKSIHEILNKAGYRTGFVGKYHIQKLSDEEMKEFPELARDADLDDPEVNEKLKEHQSILVRHVKEDLKADYAASVLWTNFGDATPIRNLQYHHLEWKTKGAVDFLKTCSDDEPFFLFLGTTALHGPNHAQNLRANPHYTPGGKLENPYEYHPSRETIFERLQQPGHKVNHFSAGTVYLDDQVGAVMSQLKELGLDDNTMVILTADHGVEPGKASVYEQGVNVPFIVRWPGMAEPGSVTNELVQFVDFMPTFADAAGIKIRNYMVDGESFLPVLKGKKGREHIYCEMGYARAVTNGRYKYIAFRLPEEAQAEIEAGKVTALNHLYWPKQAHASISLMYYPAYFDPDQLYDLENDPYEQVNLAGDPQYAEILEEMKGILNEYTTSIGFPYPLEDTGFGQTEAYKKLVEKSVNIKNTPGWWPKSYVWPPSNKLHQAKIMIRQ